MRRGERRKAILDLLVEQRTADLDDLATRFAVSRMTIHRDLDDLEQEGLLRKVRGGATIEAGTQFESDFQFRARQNGEAKDRMAAAALELIEPGMTVMVNDGSTAAILGALLPEKRPLTVITNNAAVLDRLKGEPGIKLMALGGVFSAKFNAFFGVVTEDALARLKADMAIISVPAVAGRQAFHMDEEVVRAKRAMMAAAVQSCLLVNHQRIGRSALHVLADLAQFSTVITDDDPAPEAQEALAREGIALRIARPG